MLRVGTAPGNTHACGPVAHRATLCPCSCIADQKPRAFDASSCQILNNMAELVVRHVERDIMLQLRKQDNTEMVKAYAQMQRTMDPASQCVVLVDTKVEGWRVMYANEALTPVTGELQSDLCTVIVISALSTW